jgi:NADPH:quinone reductase-like Zn-dependent oxidoreductase
MSLMKAVRIYKYGGIEELKYEDAPVPQIKPNEVLVKIKAAGINPVEVSIREGKFASFIPVDFPYILGYDAAGVVEETGADVTTLKAGDEVYGYLRFGSNGAYAEYAAVPAELLALKPKNIDFIHAAAVPITGLTIWQSFFEHANLKKGDRVFINGASGGTGVFAIQIAHNTGAYIVATSSPKNFGFLKELGADETLDYKNLNPTEIKEKFDSVLNLAAISSDEVSKLYDLLKPNGIIISLTSAPDEALAKAKNIRSVRLSSRGDAAQLKQLAALIEAGVLKPVVSETLNLSQIQLAHEEIQSNHTKGKIVIDVASGI